MWGYDKKSLVEGEREKKTKMQKEKEEEDEEEEEEDGDGRVACVRRTGRVISRHPLSRWPISSSTARLVSFFL